MNQERRTKLEELGKKLDTLAGELEALKDSEVDEVGEGDTVDVLSNAHESLTNCISEIEEACGG